MPQRILKARRISTLSIVLLVAAIAMVLFYAAKFTSKHSDLKARNFRAASTLAQVTESQLNGIEALIDSPDDSGMIRCALRRTGSVERSDSLEATLDANPGKDELRFSLIGERDGPPTRRFEITFRLSCFMENIARDEVFDHVLLVDGQSHVVYQSTGSAVRILKLDSAAAGSKGERSEGDPGRIEWTSFFSHFEEQEIAGERYALFRQPVRLEFDSARVVDSDPNTSKTESNTSQAKSDASRSSSENQTWEIVGLVRSERLTGEAMRIDPSDLVVLVTLLLLALCSWPFLKLWAIGKRERIAYSDVVWVSLASIVACSVLSLGALDTGLHRGRMDVLRRDLEASAKEIQTALRSELRDALEQLAILRCLESGSLCETSSGCELKHSTDTRTVRAELHDLICPEAGYPYIKMIFWTDDKGKQTDKFSVGQPTPLIQVDRREYFKRINEKRDLWPTSALYEEGAKPQYRVPSTFFVQPIRSWTTGYQEVVLSIPNGTGARAQRDPSQPDPLLEANGMPVAAMSIITLPSLLDPILPPGRGFAIVDPEGNVVFHSRPERNGLENLILETEEAPKLLGALFAGRSEHFVAPYLGAAHQMYTEPIHGLPWHIVVFEELAILQTANLEALFAALLLSLLEILLLALTVATLRLVCRGSLQALWPRPGSSSSLRVAALMVFVGIAFVTRLCTPGTSDALIVAGFCLPPIALGLSLVAAMRSPGTRTCRPWIPLLLAVVASLRLLVEDSRATPPWIFVDGILLLLAFAVSVAPLPLQRTQRLMADPHGRLRLLLTSWRRLSPRIHFVTVSALSILVLSALPAASFLKATLTERLGLEARRGQMHLVRQIALRSQKIEELHRDSKTPPQGWKLFSEKEGLPRDCPSPEPWNLLEPWKQLVLDPRPIHYAGYFDNCYAFRVALRAERGTEDNQKPSDLPPIWTTACSCADSLDPTEARWQRPISGWAMRALSWLPERNRHSIEARSLNLVEVGTFIEGSLLGGAPRDPEFQTQRESSTAPPRRLHVRMGVPEFAVFARLPRVGLSEQPLELALSVGILALAGTAILGSLAFLGPRMFHVGARYKTALPLGHLEARYFSRLLVIVPPETSIRDVFKGADLSVDLKEAGLGSPVGDRALERLQEGVAHFRGLIRIDHLEGVLDDAPSRARALRLFETILSRTDADLRVVVFAHKDPRIVLEAERARVHAADPKSEDAMTLARWEDMLQVLPRVWAFDPGEPHELARELASAREAGATKPRADHDHAGTWTARQIDLIREECSWSRRMQRIGHHLLQHPEISLLDARRLSERIQVEAADHYQVLWQALSAEDQHVLAQIAAGCLINPALASSLDRLLRWGLITSEPPRFHVVSESFRQFVQAQHDPRRLFEWEESESLSVWRQLRLPFLAVLFGVGTLLLLTQRQLFDLIFIGVSSAALSLPSLVAALSRFGAASKTSPD